MNNRTHLSGDDGGVSVSVPRAISDSLMALARAFEFADAAAGGDAAPAADDDDDGVTVAVVEALLAVPPIALSEDNLW